MTIAYLILCHTDPKHIRRLTEKITKNTNDVAFVHVDGKCDLISFQHELKNNSQVQILKKSVPWNWGGGIFFDLSDDKFIQICNFLEKTEIRSLCNTSRT